MGKGIPPLALARFRRPLFCCKVQESQSTFGTIQECPVHSGQCSFIDHTTVEPAIENGAGCLRGIEEEVESPVLRISATTTALHNKLAALRVRLYTLASQPAPIFRGLRNVFARSPKADETVDASLLSLAEATVLISRLSEADEELFGDDSQSCAGQSDLPSLTDDGDSLISVPLIADEILLGARNSWTPEPHKSSDALGFRSIKSHQGRAGHDNLCGLFETILFEQPHPSLFAFSYDLIQPGPGSNAIRDRTTMWQYARGYEECSLKWEMNTNAHDLMLLLRYDMLDFNRGLMSARFAAKVCVSALIPSNQTKALTVQDEDDLWLSVAEDELSSSTSLASAKDRKERPATTTHVSPPLLKHPDFIWGLAELLVMHRFCFILQPQPNHIPTYEVTHITPLLFDKVTAQSASFAEAIDIECALQRDDLERFKRFSFPFSFDTISGTLWCIPLFCTLQQLWFCVWVKHS